MVNVVGGLAGQRSLGSRINYWSVDTKSIVIPTDLGNIPKDRECMHWFH